jgi:AI-2 transport protein TqsA
MSQLARDVRIATSALVVLSFIAVAASLYYLRPVLVPFVLALFLASGLQPVLSYLERRLEISRLAALIVALVLSTLATVALWSVIGVSVAELKSKGGQYQSRLDDVIERTVLRFWLAAENVTTAVEKATQSDDTDAVDEPPQEATTATPPKVRPSSQLFEVVVSQLQADSRAIFETVSGELYGLVTNGLLVMIFLFFLLLGARVNLPPDNIWSEVDTHVRNYIVTKSVISIFTGLVFGIVLWFFGVPMAVLFGLLAFLLNFIPNLGPIIATLLPVPLLVLDPAFNSFGPEGETQWHWGWALVAFVVSGFVQFASGNIVEPRILGEQFKLHPIAILLSLIFWSILWGLPGAFLAVPITSALKIMLNESEHTRIAASLLEGDLAVFTRHQPEKTV